MSQLLSLEQKFSIYSFNSQVEQMSEEQAKMLLKQLYEQSVLKDVMYKELIGATWGIGYTGEEGDFSNGI